MHTSLVRARNDCLSLGRLQCTLHSDFEQSVCFEAASLNLSQPPLDFVAALRSGPRQFGFPQGVHGEFHPRGNRSWMGCCFLKAAAAENASACKTVISLAFHFAPNAHPVIRMRGIFELLIWAARV
jgi:hypothetical protein